MNIREDSYNKNSISFPNQMVSEKTKQKESWYKGVMDYFIDQCGINTESFRKTPKEMLENLNLYRGYMSSEFMDDALDPLGLGSEESEKVNIIKEQNYNIAKHPINTLLGDELKRRGDVRAIVVNQTAINQKDMEFKARLFEFMSQYSQQANPNIDPEVFKEELKGIEKWRKYDLQSAHEVMANQILDYYKYNSELNLKETFNRGFENLLNIGEEIYKVMPYGEDVVIKLVDSKNFYVFGLSENTKISDGYAWVEFEYLHPNEIISRYHSLSKAQIKKIFNYNREVLQDPVYDMAASSVEGGVGDGFTAVLSRENKYIPLKSRDLELSDDEGNIRVVTINYMSLRKILKITYYDDYGDAQEVFADEYFDTEGIDKENIEEIWVNEIRTGVRILDDIDINVGPCEIQMRSITNPYKVRPIYSGRVIKENSLTDSIKPYVKDFNIWAYKLKALWVQNIGRAAVVDVSRIPSWMDTEEWFFWLKNFKLAFENPFEESNKGALAGNMQQSNKTIDLSLGTEINQAITMLTWIKQQVDEISGVSRQRQGEMKANEGLGTSKQAIIQSAVQTEKLFSTHDYVKVDVLTLLLEYVKVKWKGKNIVKQFILDDLSNMILNVDGDILSEAEYGIQITNSSRLAEMDLMLDTLSHAALQTGTATLSDVAKMKMATSPSEMLAELNNSEEKRIQQQQQTQQQQMQVQQQMQQAQFEMEKIKHQQELEKIKLEFEYKMEIEKMKLLDKAKSDAFNRYYDDENQNGIRDQVEIDKAMINKEVKEEEIKSKESIAEKELNLKREIELKKLRLEEQKLKQGTKSTKTV